MDIYQEVILDHNKHPRNFGEIDNPDYSSNVANTLCGDKIKLALKIKENVVIDIAFQGDGCAISKASASMLTEELKGKSLEDLRKIDKSYILNMLGIELTPNRLKCALLPLEALHKAINHE